jgi:hypothetical protein
LETQRQVRELCAKLGSDDFSERIEAKNGLVKMRKAALQGLVSAMKSSNLQARCAAAQALGEIGEAGAVGALMDGLRDSEAKMRGECADALGIMRERSAVEGLISALGDPDANVRYKLKDALEKLTDKSFPEEEQKLESDPAAYQKLWADWWPKNKARLMAGQEKTPSGESEARLREVVPVHSHPHTHQNGTTHTHPHEATDNAHHGDHVGVDPKTIEKLPDRTRAELRTLEDAYLEAQKKQADAKSKTAPTAPKK